MEKPEIGSGSLDTLVEGNCLLINAKIVGQNKDKVQLQFAEKISTSKTEATSDVMSLVSYFNRYDDRFSSGAQRAWAVMDIQAATEDYGIDFTSTGKWYDSQEGTVMDLNILNPVLNNGRVIRLQILETVEPNAYQEANVEKTCKTRGKGGSPITFQGKYIWRNVVPVGAPSLETVIPHTLLEADPVEVKLEAVGQEMVGELESDELGL
jgi:hypothetical protein